MIVGPQIEEHRQPLQAGKGREMGSPLVPPPETRLDASDLQNCERIYLCCFKPLHLWEFVTEVKFEFQVNSEYFL